MFNNILIVFHILFDRVAYMEFISSESASKVKERMEAVLVINFIG